MPSFMTAAADPRALRRLMQQLFRRFGVLSGDSTPCGKPLSPAHAHALMILLESGASTQQELGADLGIDKSNVARLCARMVEAGHASQEQSETDGRSRRVSLTVAGKRVAREVDAASTARFAALIRGLPGDRHRQVVDALGQLVAAIGSLPAAGTRTAHKG
jgi:DNA-binding MarR family transcriptional regulator